MRKGRVMSSTMRHAWLINITKSNRLKQTKAGKAKTIGFKGARTRRINPAKD